MDQPAQRMQPSGQILQKPGLQHLQDQRAEDDAPDAADPAEHDHHQDHHRDREAEHFRGRGLQFGDEERAGRAGKGGARRKRQELHLGTVDAHRGSSELVLANRHPGAADARKFEPLAGQDQECDERQTDIVIGRCIDPEAPAEELRRGNAVQSHRAIRDVGRVAGDDRHDFAKAQGHDRQIIAPEAQGREAEQDAEERRDRRRDRHHQPERHLEMHHIAARFMKPRDKAKPLKRLPEAAPIRRHLPGGHRAVGIGADREECGVAEIEEPGEPDDDVEPERQRRKSQGIGGGVDIGVVAVPDREQDRGAKQADHRDPLPGLPLDARQGPGAAQPGESLANRHRVSIRRASPGRGRTARSAQRPAPAQGSRK